MTAGGPPGAEMRARSASSSVLGRVSGRGCALSRRIGTCGGDGRKLLGRANMEPHNAEVSHGCHEQLAPHAHQ